MNLRDRVQALVEVANERLGRSDIFIGPTLYMRRWRFTGTDDTAGMRIHNIVRSDADRELHDHPFDFASLILRGGYFEEREDGSRTWYGPGAIIFRRAEDLHRLELAEGEQPAWTFVIRGPRRREWGFKMEDGTWLGWRPFTRLRYGRGDAAGTYAAASSI